jgi:hypothetical protein
MAILKREEVGLRMEYQNTVELLQAEIDRQKDTSKMIEG